MPNLIEDWDTLTVALFEGVNLDDREAVTAKVTELFQQHKAERTDKPPADKSAYNSMLHRRLNELARQARQQHGAAKRVLDGEQRNAMKGRLKQHIKAKAKAKADSATVIDVVLDELEAMGVDLSAVKGE